jgi:uncharacterized membrane protein
LVVVILVLVLVVLALILAALTASLSTLPSSSVEEEEEEDRVTSRSKLSSVTNPDVPMKVVSHKNPPLAAVSKESAVAVETVAVVEAVMLVAVMVETEGTLNEATKLSPVSGRGRYT